MDSEIQSSGGAQEAGCSSLHEVLAGLARQLEWLSRVAEPNHKEKPTMVDMHHAGASFAYRHAAALVDNAIESIGPANDKLTDGGAQDAMKTRETQSRRSVQRMVSRLRRRYTRVVKMGDKWNTYLQIDHQGFCVVDQTSRHRAQWFGKNLAIALARMLAANE